MKALAAATVTVIGTRSRRGRPAQVFGKGSLYQAPDLQDLVIRDGDLNLNSDEAEQVTDSDSANYDIELEGSFNINNM